MHDEMFFPIVDYSCYQSHLLILCFFDWFWFWLCYSGFCSSATSQQTFQRRLNFVFRLIWRRDVPQRQINVETTLCMSTLKFSTLNWTTLDNVETTLTFSTLVFTTLGNVETMLQIWPFEKNIWTSIQKQNNIFELQRICWTQHFASFFFHFNSFMTKAVII